MLQSCAWSRGRAFQQAAGKGVVTITWPGLGLESGTLLKLLQHHFRQGVESAVQ